MEKVLSKEASENVEEYLESLWVSEEQGNPIAKVIWVARRLKVAPPSVVEMYERLEKRRLVKYSPHRGVGLVDAGRTIARRVIRNHRLVELLMKQTLNIEADERIACGVEHHMSEEFADALCTLLGHPRRCPHGNAIPRGKCCPSEEPKP